MTATAAPTFTTLVAQKVTCRAGDVEMLAPTSLTIRPGENIAILGENGCGKTTFLRVVTGNLQPTSGTITLDDAAVDERDARTRRVIAPLIGPLAGYRDLTVADHLILIDQTWGGDRDGAGDRIAQVLNRLDIMRFGNRFPSELSSGQRQLVELAMVLLRPSALLVLDEPEQRLDESRRGLLAEVLRERVDQGGSVLWVCHDRALAEQSATRLAHFPQGGRG